MTSNLEKLYHKLPVFLQNVGITCFGIHWYFRRFGGVFRKAYKAALDRSFYSRIQWQEWQEEKLRILLTYAYDTVPYYREVWNAAGWTRENMENFLLVDLEKLPILEKSTFRKLGVTAIMSTKQEPRGLFLKTSGSSGTPLKIKYSLRMHQEYFGIYEAYVRNWAGVNNRMGRGVFGGRRIVPSGESKGPFYRYNYIEKQIYFSAYHISPSNVLSYLEGMNRHPVSYLEGYASSIFFLARAFQQANLKAPQLKAILTSTDKLTEEMRRTLKEVFGCEAFDSYNGVDLCNLISECEHHRLHIVPEVGIVEILKPDGTPCLPGETGELICTGLLNRDQPLIRYKIGDLVKLSEEQTCPCGRSMTIVNEIVGRIEDVIIRRDGRELRRFNRILIDIDCVLEGQVIQHTLDDFEIKLVTSSPLSEKDLQTIKQRMEAQLGKINLSVHNVDSIPRGPNGKFKAVISKIPTIYGDNR
jgi:phenylacetate-CoA ligase